MTLKKYKQAYFPLSVIVVLMYSVPVLNLKDKFLDGLDEIRLLMVDICFLCNSMENNDQFNSVDEKNVFLCPPNANSFFSWN